MNTITNICAVSNISHIYFLELVLIDTNTDIDCESKHCKGARLINVLSSCFISDKTNDSATKIWLIK